MTNSREQRRWRDQFRDDSINIDLSKSNINDDDAVLIARELKQSTTLKAVTLSDNGIGDKGAEALADALAVSSLEHLLLQRNKIGKDGALALAKALEKTGTLQILCLAGNSIASGATALADSLKTNKTLYHLDLANNNVGDEGAMAFAKAIKVNSTLFQLILNNNNITDLGFVALDGGLKENVTLEMLGLIDNAPSCDFGETAKDAIKGTLLMDEDARFVQTLRHKLWLGTEKVSAIDCLAFPVPCDNFESWKACRLGEALQQHADLTSLKIQIEEAWDENAIENGGDLCPLLQYIERSHGLSELTYIVHTGDVNLTVVQRFFEAVAHREHAVEVALRMNAEWLVGEDRIDFFGQLMRETAFASLKHLFLTGEFWMHEFDSEQFASCLQHKTCLKSLNLGVAIAWGNCIAAVRGSSLRESLQSLSVTVEDEDTLLQLFHTLPALSQVRSLCVELLGAAVRRIWENRQAELLPTLQQNGSLQNVKLVIDGKALELPAGVVAALQRNSSSELNHQAQSVQVGQQHESQSDQLKTSLGLVDALHVQLDSAAHETINLTTDSYQAPQVQGGVSEDWTPQDYQAEDNHVLGRTTNTHGDSINSGETSCTDSTCTCAVLVEPKRDILIVADSLVQLLRRAMLDQNLISDEDGNPILACHAEKNYFIVSFHSSVYADKALTLHNNDRNRPNWANRLYLQKLKRLETFAANANFDTSSPFDGSSLKGYTTVDRFINVYRFGTIQKYDDDEYTVYYDTSHKSVSYGSHKIRDLLVFASPIERIMAVDLFTTEKRRFERVQSALSELADFCSEEQNNRALAIRLGGISTILRAMKKFVVWPHVQAQGFRTLHIIAGEDDDFKGCAVTSIDAIFSILTFHSKDHLVLAQGYKALSAIICCKEDANFVVRKWNGVPLIIQAMNLAPENAELQECANLALYKLLQLADGGEEAIVGAGGRQVLSDVMRNHTN